MRNPAFKVTNAGHDLLAALLETGKGLEITRVTVGTGAVAEDQELREMTELVEYITEGAVTERKHQGNEFYLTVQYANIMTPGLGAFYLREFAVEARDPRTNESTMILYAALNDMAQPVMAYSENLPPDTHNFPLTIVISDEIEVTVDAAAGLITYEDLEEATRTEVDRAMGQLQPGWCVAGSVDLTIPRDGWTQVAPPSPDRTDYRFICYVPVEGVTANLYPDGAPWPGYFGIAARAGVLGGCDVLNGSIRFYAKAIPEADIKCTINLLRRGGSGGGSGGNVDPGIGLSMGLDGKLNVNVGDGITVDEENKLTVDKQTVITDTDLLDEDETEQDLKEILTGGGDQEEPAEG